MQLVVNTCALRVGRMHLAMNAGEPSFGKGLIQRTFALPNGGALKLTIGALMSAIRRRVWSVNDSSTGAILKEGGSPMGVAGPLGRFVKGTRAHRAGHRGAVVNSRAIAYHCPRLLTNLLNIL